LRRNPRRELAPRRRRGKLRFEGARDENGENQKEGYTPQMHREVSPLVIRVLGNESIFHSAVDGIDDEGFSGR
jgi:hypothetical protein